MPAKSLQSCLTLCNPMDSSLPGSSIHGLLQARILEGVAVPSSRSDPNICLLIFFSKSLRVTRMLHFIFPCFKETEQN